MSLLPDNISILKERFPAVCKILDDTKAIVTSGKLEKHEGDWTLSYIFRDKKVHPYGVKKSNELIARWASKISLKSGSLYAMAGFGTGRHIKTLLEKADKESCIFLVEQDIGWLRELFSKVDCSEILRDRRFILGIGRVNDDLFKGLSDLNLNLVKEVEPIIFSPLHHLAEEYYNEFFSAFARYIGVARKMQQTGVEDAGVWQESTIKNLKYLMLAPDIGETKGLFFGLPLVLVSAGPSLDRSLDFLKKVKSKAIIVCVNTAYRALARVGVKPHFAIAADPRMSTYRGFEGQDIGGVHLICSHFVNPEVAKMFRNRAFTWSTNNKLINLVRDRLGLKPATPLVEQGTVAASIFSLANLWGCNKVCFVGQDLAIREDGQGHASDTFYRDYGELYEEVSKCRKLPGNVQSEVLVEEKLYVYLKVFNELIRECSGIEFINTSELGVKIEGAPYKTFEEASVWLGNRDTESYRAKITSLIGVGVAEGMTRRKMEQALAGIRSFSDRLFTICLEAGLQVMLLPQKLSGSTYSEHSGIKRAMEYSKEIKKLIDQYPEEAQVLFDGKAKKELHKYMDFCRTYQANEKHWEVVVKNGEYYWAMAEGAYHLLSTIEAEVG